MADGNEDVMEQGKENEYKKMRGRINNGRNKTLSYESLKLLRAFYSVLSWFKLCRLL